MYLTTSQATEVIEIPDVAIHASAEPTGAAIVQLPAASKTTAHTIVGVSKVAVTQACNVCHKKVTPKSSPQLMFCMSCNMTRLATNCIRKMYALIQLSDIPQTVTIFQDCLQSIRDAAEEEYDALVMNMTIDEVELMLLTQPLLNVKFSPEGRTIIEVAFIDL